jgi:hypothetical protein
MFILKKPRPRCMVVTLKTIRNTTAKWSVNAAALVSTPRLFRLRSRDA